MLVWVDELMEAKRSAVLHHRQLWWSIKNQLKSHLPSQWEEDVWVLLYRNRDVQVALDQHHSRKMFKIDERLLIYLFFTAIGSLSGQKRFLSITVYDHEKLLWWFSGNRLILLMDFCGYVSALTQLCIGRKSLFDSIQSTASRDYNSSQSIFITE